MRSALLGAPLKSWHRDAVVFFTSFLLNSRTGEAAETAASQLGAMWKKKKKKKEKLSKSKEYFSAFIPYLWT